MRRLNSHRLFITFTALLSAILLIFLLMAKPRRPEAKLQVPTGSPLSFCQNSGANFCAFNGNCTEQDAKQSTFIVNNGNYPKNLKTKLGHSYQASFSIKNNQTLAGFSTNAQCPDPHPKDCSSKLSACRLATDGSLKECRKKARLECKSKGVCRTDLGNYTLTTASIPGNIGTIQSDPSNEILPNTIGQCSKDFLAARALVKSPSSSQIVNTSVVSECGGKIQHRIDHWDVNSNGQTLSGDMSVWSGSNVQCPCTKSNLQIDVSLAPSILPILLSDSGLFAQAHWAAQDYCYSQCKIDLSISAVGANNKADDLTVSIGSAKGMFALTECYKTYHLTAKSSSEDGKPSYCDGITEQDFHVSCDSNKGSTLTPLISSDSVKVRRMSAAVESTEPEPKCDINWPIDQPPTELPPLQDPLKTLLNYLNIQDGADPKANRDAVNKEIPIDIGLGLFNPTIKPFEVAAYVGQMLNRVLAQNPKAICPQDLAKALDTNGDGKLDLNEMTAPLFDDPRNKDLADTVPVGLKILLGVARDHFADKAKLPISDIPNLASFKDTICGAKKELFNKLADMEIAGKKVDPDLDTLFHNLQQLCQAFDKCQWCSCGYKKDETPACNQKNVSRPPEDAKQCAPVEDSDCKSSSSSSSSSSSPDSTSSSSTTSSNSSSPSSDSSSSTSVESSSSSYSTISSDSSSSSSVDSSSTSSSASSQSSSTTTSSSSSPDSTSSSSLSDSGSSFSVSSPSSEDGNES